MSQFFLVTVLSLSLTFAALGRGRTEKVDPGESVTVNGVRLGNPSNALRGLVKTSTTIIDPVTDVKVYRIGTTKLVTIRGLLVSVTGDSLEQTGLSKLRSGMTRDRVERVLALLGPAKGNAEEMPINLLPIWPVDLAYSEKTCKWLVRGTGVRLNYVLVCYWRAGALSRIQIGDGQARWNSPSVKASKELQLF